MAPSEPSAHPKMLLKSPSKPSLAGLSRAKMSKVQLPKGEDFKRNPDCHEPQPARVGGRKGSTGVGTEKNGATTTTATMGRAKSRAQLNPETIKVVEHVNDHDGFYNDLFADFAESGFGWTVIYVDDFERHDLISGGGFGRHS